MVNNIHGNDLNEFCSNVNETTEAIPLLTIVTVFRNPGDLIKTNISSLLLQEGDNIRSLFEHLLIDGQSTDSCLSLVQKYTNRAAHPVRVYSQPDRGISHAFNIGLALARGNWIWFLNADDFLYSPQVVVNVLKHINNLAPHERIVAGSIIFTDKLLQKQTGVMIPEINKVHMGMYLPHPALITSREVFNACGGFSESFKIGMDYDWLARVANNKNNYIRNVKITHDHFVIYRRSGISSTVGNLVWKEFYATRLHNEHIFSATMKYLYVLVRELLVTLIAKTKKGRNGQELSSFEQRWIDRVLKTSEEI